MLRGVSSTLQPFASFTGVSEYWIARFRGRRRLRVLAHLYSSDAHPRSRRALRPSCAFISRPPIEGVGNAGCPLHPRPRVHFVLVERTRVTTSTPERPAFPHAMVLRRGLDTKMPDGQISRPSRSTTRLVLRPESCSWPGSNNTQSQRSLNDHDKDCGARNSDQKQPRLQPTFRALAYL